MSARGWGYALDYPKAIAQDRAALAVWDSPMMRAISASLTDEERGWLAGRYKYDVIDWVMTYPDKREERASIAGLPLEEVICASLYMDMTVPDLAHEPEPERWWSRGAAACKAVAHIEQVVTEPERRRLVAKYKAALARHVRNQKK